jgi:transposase
MKKRRETDARSLGREALTELRTRAVAQVQAGESPEVVAAAIGINRTTIYDWISLYRHGGKAALDAKKRGGRRRKLDGVAMRWIYRTVATKNPLQLQFPFALWTCDMIRVLIRQKFSVELSRSSVGRLLEQLGLSAQRPLWRAYQQNPQEVERWLKQTFPKIKAEAKACRAEIYFGDEAGVRSDFHAGTTWAPQGRTPIVSSTGARFGFNLISAVSARGLLRFMIVEGKVGASTFITFLKRLMLGATRPIFLIVDGHPSHRAKLVARYIASLGGKLRLIFLPAYSPELNPDELVWNSLKNTALGRRAHHDKAGLKQAAISHLRFLQKTPAMVRSFFHAPYTAYAAAA